MLSDLPFEMVDAIAKFLDYQDLVSLKLTCKSLKGHVDFVKVRRLNMFVNSLPYEGRLFHVDEPTVFSEAVIVSLAKIQTPAFRDRFKHLKRLTIQQKNKILGSFILERDLNCFEQLEHLELRACEINAGGRLCLNKLQVLLVETKYPVRYVVDCEQLVAIHLTDLPEIVHPGSLRYASVVDMRLQDFVQLCEKCPNLTRITLSSYLFDSSLPFMSGDFDEMSTLRHLDILAQIFATPYEPHALIATRKLLGCLERIDFDVVIYDAPNFQGVRAVIRGFRPPSRLWEDVGSPGREVFERLRFYVGSQDVVNELFEVVHDQFINSAIHHLKLINLTYSDLVKYKRPMECLISGLKYILIDRRYDLAREPLLFRLANLRQLKIEDNVLDEVILNQFIGQFKYLEHLSLTECAIQGESLALLPNHSVHMLLIKNCTCSDLNFVKSFKNVKNLLLFELGLEEKFRSIPGSRQSFYSILSSLRFLKIFVHETLGTLYVTRDGPFLSPQHGTSWEATIRDGFRDDPTPDCLRFENLDQFIRYATTTE